jgi:pseudaminic acid biosynthesis-associated methylase
MKFKTKQEEFWSGEFGDEYIERNIGDTLLASNLNFFSTILSGLDSIKNVLEFGSNVGMNLKALKHLLPEAQFGGIEINEKAFTELTQISNVKGYHTSILDFKVDYQRDLVLIKTVLIHINPEELQSVYKKLYDSSGKYICIAEYYNITPVELNYRGHSGKLFKRDFAGEMMTKYSDLRLVKYGFAYHGDKLFPQDDITWFLLKK